MNQGNMTITAYFTKFRTLIAEIDDLNPLPKCTYTTSSCTSQNAQKLDKYEDMIKLSKFLMGLSDQYTSIRGQLHLMQPVPTISQALSLLLQEESQKEFAKASQSPFSESIAAMNVKYNHLEKFRNSASNTGTQKKSSDTSVFCDYCQNTGHAKEKCFCLHGYPDWHRLHGKPKPKPRRFSNSGTGNGNIKSAVNVSTIANSSSVMQGDSKVDSVSVKDSGTFSDAQCQQLSKLIQETLRQNMASTSSHMSGTSFYSCVS